MKFDFISTTFNFIQCAICCITQVFITINNRVKDFQFENMSLGFQTSLDFSFILSFVFRCLSRRCSSICWRSLYRKSRMQSSEMEINLWRLIVNAFKGSWYRPWHLILCLLFCLCFHLKPSNRTFLSFFFIAFIVRQIYHTTWKFRLWSPVIDLYFT